MIKNLTIATEFTQDKNQIERYRNLMSVNCVTDYFLRLSINLKIGNIQKIVIECAEHEITKKSDYTDDDLGVQILRREINIDHFLKLSEKQKGKWTLDLLISGFEELSEHFEFSMNDIYTIANTIQENNFLNHYYYGKAVSSPNKLFKAILWVEHDPDKFNIFVQLTDKDNNVLKKILVKKADPYFISYYQLLGSIKWESNSELRVFNSKKVVMKTINVL